MEDMVGEASAQALNQLYSEGVEQARQELERAIMDEEMPEEMPEEASLSPEEEVMLAEAMDEVHHEIPENSQTITVDETTSRFSGAIWYEEIQKQTVTLAGIGGIGSYVGFLLGRLKPLRLIIYDPDRVETVNMSGQLYGQSDVGSYKSTALANMVGDYANYTI